MTYKNSIKILFSNFNIVWKSMLNFAFISIVGIFFIYLCLNPIYILLEESGFIGLIVDTYTEFLTSLNLTKLFVAIDEIFIDLFEFIKSNISTIWINFTGVFVVLIFWNLMLSNLTIMATCDTLHYYMGSMNNHGYFTSFRETFGKNVKVQFAYLIVSLPFKALTVVLFGLSLKLFAMSWLWSLLGVFVIVSSVVLSVAFKYTILSSWIPTMVIMNFGVWKSLSVSIKNVFRKFGKIYSTAIGVFLTILIVNVFMGLFTLGVGLVLSIPISYLLYSSFGMVVGYEGQGMRYYVDVYNVITPAKREKTDKLVDMKFIV